MRTISSGCTRAMRTWIWSHSQAKNFSATHQRNLPWHSQIGCWRTPQTQTQSIQTRNLTVNTRELSRRSECAPSEGKTKLRWLKSRQTQRSRIKRTWGVIRLKIRYSRRWGISASCNDTSLSIWRFVLYPTHLTKTKVQNRSAMPMSSGAKTWQSEKITSTRH